MNHSNLKLDGDEYLVSLIANHPGIYDKRHDSYKDYQRKQESWDAIASALNLDAESVRRRWENLRDRFVRVYREYTSSGNSTVVRSKFKLFEHMLWLAPHIRKRRMTSSIVFLKNKALQSQLKISHNDDTQSSEINELHDTLNLKTETQSNTTDITYQDSFLDKEALLSSAADAVSVQNENEMLNKSDHYFMKSVIYECQSMPPRKKIKFKKEVLGLLEKYLYDDEK